MNSFFMVWCPEDRLPRVRHKSIGVAKREAQRLAALHPGKTFIVLKSKYEITYTDVSEEVAS